MKAIVTASIAMIGLIGVGTGAYADGTRDPGVNARQHHQRDRIQQGVRSGELTGKEAHGLAKEQREVRQLERDYKSDGTLTKDERKDLHQEQNQASRHIYNQKHDAQKR